MECTIDWGCTTTSMRSTSTPNSADASSTSRPLFISVEESMVILGAHRPRRVGQRVGLGDLAQPLRRPARGRGRPRRSAAAGARRGGPARRASRRGTGGSRSARSRPAASWRPGVWRTFSTSGAAAMSDSLLARARVRPASSAARVTGRPAKPMTALTTTSAPRASVGQPLGADDDLDAVPQEVDQARAVRLAGHAHARHGELVGDRGQLARGAGPRDTTTRSKDSGSRRSTSRVWVPIEPVAPSRATRRRDAPTVIPV